MSDIIITVVSGETVDIGLSVPGTQGPAGINTTPSGGVANDLLIKQSATDYDSAWGSVVSGITAIAATLSGTTVNSGVISGGTVSGATLNAAVINSPTLSGSSSVGSGFVLGGSSEKLGFYGASAIVRPSGIAAPSGGSTLAQVITTVSGIVIALRNLGLIAE